MKRYKLNEELKSFDMFQMNEDGSVETEVAEAPSDAVANSSSREDMLADVDSIINSLETLAGQVVESLNEEIEQIDEIATKNLADAFNYMVVAPKARKAQKKVNQMRMQIQDMEYALDRAETDNAKERLEYKIEKSKEQVEHLQDSVIDRYDNHSDIAMRARKNEKIKGDIELSKRAIGMDPSQAETKKLKKRMARLSNTLDKEEAALRKFEPNATEKEEMTKRIEADRAKRKQNSDDADKMPNESLKIQESMDIKKDLMTRAAALNNEELVNRISTKEGWQLNGTKLQRDIETEIRRAEANKTLNDNRYDVTSIKDAFSKLI
jgi:hypothetical protein